MTAFERARSAAQKAERRHALLAAAARLYDREDFDGITLAAVAREAGFTRSNLYKYYRTREAIFLDLLCEDVTTWSAGLVEAWRAAEPTAPAFAHAWAQGLDARPRLLRLLSILHTHLERGVSAERLQAYKGVLYTASGAVIAALCAAFPALSPEAAEDYLMVQLAVVSGLFPMTHLTVRQQAAASAVGFRSYAGRFAPLCEQAAAVALAAALAAAGRAPGAGAR